MTADDMKRILVVGAGQMGARSSGACRRAR